MNWIAQLVVALIIIVAIIAIGIWFWNKVMPNLQPPWSYVVYAIAAILAIGLLLYLASMVGLIGAPGPPVVIGR